jgi:hypothetical protein
VKIVINACHGGFGLSDEAFEKLLEAKGIEFDKAADSGYPGFAITLYYEKGKLGDDAAYLNPYQICTRERRDDPDLVAIVEEMGEASWGKHALLKVVEIPDDVDWYIDCYNGREWIAEKHRTWE